MQKTIGMMCQNLRNDAAHAFLKFSIFFHYNPEISRSVVRVLEYYDVYKLFGRDDILVFNGTSAIDVVDRATMEGVFEEFQRIFSNEAKNSTCMTFSLLFTMYVRYYIGLNNIGILVGYCVDDNVVEGHSLIVTVVEDNGPKMLYYDVITNALSEELDFCGFVPMYVLWV